MKKFYFISYLFVLLLAFTINSFGQLPNSPKGIQTNIISTTPSSTTVEFILNHYEETTVDVNGISTVFYNIPGSIWLMDKGFPQLPIHRESIIIPDLAGMNYRIIDQEFNTIETLPVMPSKGHLTRNIDPSNVSYSFNDIYTRDVWYPENNIILDQPYIVRELRGLTIQLNPMQYNPAEGKLKICTRIVVEVFSDPSVAIVNPLVRMKPFTGVSPDFVDVYKSLFINYGSPNYDYVPIGESGRLLIIYPTSFASNITPLYDWKIERGLTTLLAEYPTQTGTGSAAIKNYIQNLYDSPEGLTFIILVGESNQIPTLNGTYEGAPSDPCFVKLAGTDAYPDAYISRISPTSTTNLDYIIYKFIKYEKYPDTGPGAGWYLKGTGVASNEDGGTGTYDWERMNLLRDMLINNMYFTTVDQIYDPGATIAQVNAALNDGRSLVNYIGHGSGTSWGTTGFGNSNIYALSNQYKEPFVLDVACDNGDFTLSECMEEAWVRAGSMSDPKGAIGSFGASTLASWVPPCDMQYHAMFLLTTRAKQTVGGICFNGIMYAMDQWGGSSGEGLKLMEQYNIMGDCSMLLTLGMLPDSTAPDQITDLAAVDPTSNSVSLNWTSPYDSSFGGIVSYDLRYSNNPIVTENDYNNAASVIIAGNPDSVGVAKTYTLHELSFSTQYYFAIKASDIWGNKSPMSNVPVQTTWDAPQINITPDSIDCTLLPDSTWSDSLLISNVSSANSTLDYSIELTNNTFPGEVYARLVPVNNKTVTEFTKANPDLHKGMSFRGSGGPDIFGYEWIDSNDPQGPEYIWNDISATGTLVTNWVATSVYPPTDEGKAGPFNLGFNFKFYGVEYSNVYFYSNGFISFTDYNDAFMTNGTIPSSDEPNNIIAAVWDDLDGSSNGHVYYKAEENKFIIQYTDWPGYYSGTGPFTFQIVLNKNGKIMIYYNSVQGSSSSCTVGIEKFDGSDGLQIVNNANYLESNLALQFSAEPEWLIPDNYSGTIYNGNSFAVILNFITEGLELGDYSMDVVVSSNDPVNPVWTVPVTMEITEIPVELTSFTAEKSSDAVLLKWITATEKNNRGFDIEKCRSVKNPDNSDIINQEWGKIGYVAGNGTTTEPKNYSFKDNNLTSGNFSYRLKQIDFNGSFHYSEPIEIEINNIPAEFTLSQNYPNPFNPVTTFKYDIPVQSRVILNIYDGLGGLVKTLVNEVKDPGKYSVTWNGRNNDNNQVASGFYICKMTAGKFVNIKKMLLLK